MQKIWAAAVLSLILFFPLLGLADIMQDCPEEIEVIWNIEDQRTESEVPLTTRLYNGNDLLGYDSSSDTFYCPLSEALEDWPSLEIHAEQEDISLIWQDDYAYDSIRDAMSGNQSYEAMAYTQGEYHSFHIVFTGLPIAVITSAEEIDEEYVPAEFDLAAPGYEAVHSEAKVHLRAGGDVHEFPKLSYRVELHKTTKKGKDKKNKLSLLGMPEDSDWLFIASPKDDTAIRNYLGWQMWNAWNEGTVYNAPLQGRMTEVFENGKYMGLHLLLQRIHIDDELQRLGGDISKDFAFRIIHSLNIEEHPIYKMTDITTRLVELRSAPEGVTADEAFSVLHDFETLTIPDESDYRWDERHLNDEDFTELALKRLDVRELVNLFAYIQATSLGFDNVHNNIYIWAIHEPDGNVRLHFSPWDLDQTYETDEYNTWTNLTERILDLNVGGAREILWEIWNKELNSVLSDEQLHDRLAAIDSEINDAGAFWRESITWQSDAAQLDLSWMLQMAKSHRDMVNGVFSERWPIEGTEQ